MLKVTQWTENGSMYTIQEFSGQAVAEFKYAIREGYNSVLTIYNDGQNPITSKMLIELGKCISDNFGPYVSFGIVSSDMIHKFPFKS